MNKGTTAILHYLLLFVLIYFVLFLKLGSFHMRWWDESMFAVNTYEMLHNGKWFSLYFDGAPDLYNSKPPLTSWLQILFVKFFGFNELALRLPSALATCLTIVFLFKFMAQYFDYLRAWITSLILLTSYGFIHFHTARTADSDALLTFFVFIANFYFFKYVLNQSRRYKLLFFLFITLAFSTKLYAALLFSPAYLFLLLYKRLFKKFVFDWSFLLGIFFFILTTGSLLYLRELETPGYLNEVIFKDAGRVMSVVENHNESTFFYLENLLNYRYSIWFVFAVLGIVLSYYHPKNTRKDVFIFSLSLIISYLLVITISITKLEWYDMPLFPYLSIFAAYPIYIVIENTTVNNKTTPLVNKYIILAIIMFFPYLTLFNKAQGNTIKNGELQLEANEVFLFEKIKNNESIDNIKVLYKNWKGSLLFYKYRLAELDQKIDLITNVTSVSVNDRVLVCDDALKAKLSNIFRITLIDKARNADLYLIESK